jgi:hypothetical protein
MCSTCLSRTTSDFFMILSAKKQLLGGGFTFVSLDHRVMWLRRLGASTRRTRPKVPVPSVSRSTSSSSNLFSRFSERPPAGFSSLR